MHCCSISRALTAVIAWVVFRENVDSQVFLGMVAIVAGGTLLSWTPGGAGVPVGALLIVGACLCWAVDNNLTRKVAANDAMVIACAKGLIAGPVNIGIALATGATLPAVPVTAAAMLTKPAVTGSASCCSSSHCVISAARAGAYFSIAPLFGVVLSLLIWPALPPATFWIAAVLMALGIWLHVRERHEHARTSHSSTRIGIGTTNITSMRTILRTSNEPHRMHASADHAQPRAFSDIHHRHRH